MNISNFPENVGDATIAYYFLCGIKHGLFEADCAKEWAFDVIAARDLPPIEIIELATAKTRDANFCALSEVRGDADKQAAGRWLLEVIRARISLGTKIDWQLLGCAMRIVRDTELPEEIYCDFDAVDDDLFLAEDQLFGVTLDTCKIRFFTALKEHAVALKTETDH